MSRLPDYSEALSAALHAVNLITRQESVSLDQASGRVLAEDVIADRDLPPFNRAMMDGYALRANEFTAKKSWPVAAVISAGDSAEIDVPNGQCVSIATGAPLPKDVDTVIPHEQSDRGDRHGKPVHFTIESILRGSAVHPKGADAKQGDVLIQQSTEIAAHHIGISASVGQTSLSVVKRPRTTVLSSGDEVLEPDRSVLPHQIRNSNQPMAEDLLRKFGAGVIECAHIADEFDPTRYAVQNAIESSDILVTIGGISAGERDYFSNAFKECGVTCHLQGAAIQPGRPILVGSASNGCVVIGLPGNPVSVLACTCLFVWPVVRVMLGLEANLPWRDVVLADAVKPNPRRRAFRPAILESNGQIVVPSWSGSGDLSHTAPTDGLVELSVQEEMIPAETSLRFLPWP